MFAKNWRKDYIIASKKGGGFVDKMHLEKMSTAELKSRLLGSEGTIANLFQDEGPVTGSMTKSYMAANSERFAIKEILARRGEKVD